MRFRPDLDRGDALSTPSAFIDPAVQFSGSAILAAAGMPGMAARGPKGVVDAALRSFAGIDATAAGKLSSLTLDLIEDARARASVALNNVFGVQETLSLDSLITVDIKLSVGFGQGSLMPFVALGLINPVRVDNLVSGQIRLADIGKIAALEQVGTVSYSPHATAAGAVISGAESALGTLALNDSGYTGAGVKVGVLSDSYNYLKGAAAGVSSGDLPAAGVRVLADAGTAVNPTSDEGRAMLEIVHDIAPGSPLLFATAWQGMAGFAQNIQALADAGARVIVDDIAYFAQLTFTDDVIRRAINNVTAQGNIYLTANGNDAMQGVIESNPVYRETDFPALDFDPTAPDTYNLLDFNPATPDVIETLSFTAEQTGTVYLRMTWSSPAWSVHQKQASADLDFYVTDSQGELVDFSWDDQTSDIFDPIKLLKMNVVAGETYGIWIDQYSGTAPQYVQVNAPVGDIRFNQPALFDEYSAVYGNALAAGAISVGAVYYKDSPKLNGSGAVEYFSSYGKAYLTHDAAGNAIAAPQVSYGAEVAGVDGLNTTFFGFDADGDRRPNFFGTSAAAPSVAAVVALILEKNPTLTRDQVLNLLQSTAYNAVSYAGEAAFDPVSGAGLVNAVAALEAATGADFTAPTVTQFSPVDGATAVPTYANIALKFDEAIQRGSGTIRIVASSPSGTVRESFDAASSSRLKIVGDTLTIDPTSNLAGLTRYFVTFSAGAVKDLAGNKYAGTTTYDFVTAAADTTAPTVAQFSPRDGLTGVSPETLITLTFSEAIQRGTGTIYLRSGSSWGTVLESFNAASSDRLSISDRTLTIDPVKILANNTRYYVTFSTGTVKDLAGNNYAGTSSYDFVTGVLTQTLALNAELISGADRESIYAGDAQGDAQFSPSLSTQIIGVFDGSYGPASGLLEIGTL